jgi:hypothetical protein
VPLNTAYNAQLGNVTYYVTSRDYGHPAYLEVRDPRGGLKRLDLGRHFNQAKQVSTRPIHALSSLAPLRQEPTAISYASPPTTYLQAPSRTFGLQGIEGFLVSGCNARLPLMSNGRKTHRAPLRPRMMTMPLW